MKQMQLDLEKISQHLTSKASAPWTWVFYGDSITHGAAHTHGFRSLPEIFAERLRWEMRFLYDVIVNTGISGQTTVQLLDEKRYEWRVRRFKPDVVFILIGSNDIAKLKDAEKYRANLISLVRRVREDGAIPILQTNNNILHVPENSNYMLRYEKLPEYNQTVRQVAEAESVILVDHEKYWAQNVVDEQTLKRWLGEPIHPGSKGHLEMAKLIFQTLNIFDPESPCCNISQLEK